MAEDGNNPWYLGRDGQQHGPIQDIEMRKLVELGHLRPGDLVWRQGLADWQPAESMFPPVPAPAKVQPSPPPAPPQPVIEAKPAPAPLEPEPQQRPSEPTVRRDPAPDPVPKPEPRPTPEPKPAPVTAAQQPAPQPKPVSNSEPEAERKAEPDRIEPKPVQPTDAAAAGPRAPADGPAGLNDRIASARDRPHFADAADAPRPPASTPKPSHAAAPMQPLAEPVAQSPQPQRVHQPAAPKQRMPDPAPGEPTLLAVGAPRPLDPTIAASIIARFGETPQAATAHQRSPAAQSDWSRASETPVQPQHIARGAGFGPVAAAPPAARGPIAPPAQLDYGEVRPAEKAKPGKRSKSSRASVGKARVRRRIAVVLLTPLVFGALAAAAYVYRDQVTVLAGSVFDKLGAKSAGEAGKGPAIAELVRAQGGNGAVWDLVAVEFPEFAADRLREAQRMRADKKDEFAVAKFLTEAVIGLRRSYTSEAFASSPERIKAIAVTFVETLDALRKQGDEPCFSYISHGEASEPVLKVAGQPALRAAIDKQLVAVVQAIAEGRKAPQTNLPPRKSDYDTLAAELVRRGWTDNDLQVFSDPRLLAKATPQKACQLVSDWFTAHLGIADQSVQTRLLIESLRPVVSG